MQRAASPARARAPRAPCAFAPWPQGRPASEPTCLSAKRGGTGRPRSDSAPAWSAAPAPPPPVAPRPASAVSPAAPRRSALPACSAAVAATRLPFSLSLKENQISCFARAPAPLPPPQLPLAVPGASPPPPPPALRSSPRAPPLRPRSRAAPASWLRPQPPGARPPLTSPAAAAPRPRFSRTSARRAPRPRPAGAGPGARVPAATTRSAGGTSRKSALFPWQECLLFVVPLGTCFGGCKRSCLNSLLCLLHPCTVCVHLPHFVPSAHSSQTLSHSSCLGSISKPYLGANASLKCEVAPLVS